MARRNLALRHALTCMQDRSERYRLFFSFSFVIEVKPVASIEDGIDTGIEAVTLVLTLAMPMPGIEEKHEAHSNPEQLCRPASTSMRIYSVQ